MNTMKKLFLLSFVLTSVWSCGGSTTPEDTGAAQGGVDSVESLDVLETNPVTDDNIGATASGFCESQKQLQILSTSLLSTYAVKGNGSDMNYISGTSELIEDGLNFDINVDNYRIEARGQEVVLNASISGAIESGANFTSDINNLTIQGDGVDLQTSGNTWDGRADDMFMNLDISDLTHAIELSLEYTNIKKGEFDFGYLNLPGVGRFKYQFIDHFNADNTQGMLFIYGDQPGEMIIISADNGQITVVYKKDKQDSGTLITGTSCDS